MDAESEVIPFPKQVSEVVNLIQQRISNYPYKFAYDSEENADQDFSLRFSCIQGWFIRCSFKSKVNFLKSCAMHVKDLDLLITIINTLYTVTSKDRIYSLARGNFQSADMKLSPDDNRCLDKETLKKVMNNQINWFKILSPIKQYFFLSKLITLADGLVVINNIFAHFIEVLVTLIRLNILTKNVAANQISSVGQLEVDIELRELIDECFHKVVPRRTTKNFVLNSELNSLLLKWKQFISKYTEQNSQHEINGEEEISTPSNKSDEKAMDILQVLPLWVNFSILNNLEYNTELSKINEYWVISSREFKAEVAARKQLNNDIAALQEQIGNIHFNQKVQPELPELRNRISIITKPSFRNKFKTKNAATRNSLICDVYKDYLLDFNLFSKKLQSFPRSMTIYKSKLCSIE